MLEWGAGPVSGAGTGPASCSEGSRVLPLSRRACFIILKACCKVPEGADRDRPSGREGARKEMSSIFIFFKKHLSAKVLFSVRV